jgi:hypothetical protein
MFESHGWVQNRIYSVKIIMNNDFNSLFYIDELELFTEGVACKTFPSSFYLQPKSETISKEIVVTTSLKPL